MTITVGIVFGGASTEHEESIRAAQILYKHAISKLDYHFEYFYLTHRNEWVNAESSEQLIKTSSDEIPESFAPTNPPLNSTRILTLTSVNVVYNLMMGSSGENGNIMGCCDLFKIPMIGCGILASALTLNKHLSKVVAESAKVPIVPYLVAKSDADVNQLVEQINTTVKFPCFVKPNDLGSCTFVYPAQTSEQFKMIWPHIVKKNIWSSTYLIEQYIPNYEVRVFIYEDQDNQLHLNDNYVTKLVLESLHTGDDLFECYANCLPDSIRTKIREYAETIYRTFGMKDYSRVDFLISDTDEIYFNEANTQPFIGEDNVTSMERDSIPYSQFLDLMIRRNIVKSFLIVSVKEC